MLLTLSRKSMSRKLSCMLLIFGFIWGLMLLRYTFQHPRHQSSAELRVQILDLSKRYVKALAEENKSTVNGGNGDSMAGYVSGKQCDLAIIADLKRTIAVLLDDILQRLVKLESKVDDFVGNGLSTNSTNGTSGNLVPVIASKRSSTTGTVR